MVDDGDAWMKMNLRNSLYYNQNRSLNDLHEIALYFDFKLVTEEESLY